MKFIDLGTNGHHQQKEAITQSTGVSDASKIIATNASGQVDSSFLPQDFLLDQSIAIAFFLNG